LSVTNTSVRAEVPEKAKSGGMITSLSSSAKKRAVAPWGAAAWSLSVAKQEAEVTPDAPTIILRRLPSGRTNARATYAMAGLRQE